MNTIFQKEINSFILVYLDDILIYSRSIGEHWDHLKCALDKLRRAKLFGRLHKCEFLKDKVDYLGFEVSQRRNSHLTWKGEGHFGLAPPAFYARYSFIFGTGFVLQKTHSRILAIS